MYPSCARKLRSPPFVRPGLAPLPNRAASHKYTGTLLSLPHRTTCPATLIAQKRGEAVGKRVTSSPLHQSMRPTSRHRDRGRPACTTLESQWASRHSCFKGAMTIQPWIQRLIRVSTQDMPWLQWSHGLSAMDTFQEHARRRSRRAASMEPRPSSHGYGDQGPEHEGGVGASMEP